MKKFANNSREIKQRSNSYLDKIRRLAKNIILSLVGKYFSNNKQKVLRCFYCHWVFDDNVKNFIDIIEFLRQRGTFIDTGTCCAMIGGRKEIDQTYFHLSFDDGFKNHLINAAKILYDMKVPACFFVPTAFIGADYERTEQYCIHIAHYKSPIELLTWDDCKNLLDLGFDVGSHTVSHANLAQISNSDELLTYEIYGSKEELEKRLSYECKYISWPFGRQDTVNQKVISRIKKAGYKACFSGVRGKITSANSVSLFEVPRHHFEADWPVTHIAAFAKGFWGK